MSVATVEIGSIASSSSVPPASPLCVIRTMIRMTTAPSPTSIALRNEPRRPTMRRISAASIAVSVHRAHVAGLAVAGELEEAILEALALAPDLGHADAGLDERAVERDQTLVADVGDLEVERAVPPVAAHARHERDA